MSSLFAPDVPQQSAVVTQQQQDEQARSELARQQATQEQLRQETLIRNRRTGTRSLLGDFGQTSLLGSN